MEVHNPFLKKTPFCKGSAFAPIHVGLAIFAAGSKTLGAALGSAGPQNRGRRERFRFGPRWSEASPKGPRVAHLTNVRGLIKRSVHGMTSSWKTTRYECSMWEKLPMGGALSGKYSSTTTWAWPFFRPTLGDLPLKPKKRMGTLKK